MGIVVVEVILLGYIGLVICLIVIYFQWKKSKEWRNSLSYRQYRSADEFKRTMALGLYQRFCKESEETRYSSLFLKEDPLSFEHFVADILAHRYGHDFHVTQSSGDFGVDIEHGIGEGKVLGQVKCYKDDIAFDPIALIHSNMVKQGASRGYVVTTSSFTENAQIYANGLDIDLIDGVQLVDMWINYKNPVIEIIDEQPFDNNNKMTPAI